jgi:restriction endonuclease S subunit
MNTKHIKDIALVIAGYSFRSALKPHLEGSMAVIQAKDIVDNLYILPGSLTKINPPQYQAKAIIQKDDIVISSRGSFRANIVQDDTSKMIAASSVYVLRLQDKNISPEYLTIYLNSIDGRKKIKEKVTGSVIKTILRKDLENIKIPIPSQDIQNKIIKIYKNNQTQQKLLTKKKILINQVVESSISNFLK